MDFVDINCQLRIWDFYGNFPVRDSSKYFQVESFWIFLTNCDWFSLIAVQLKIVGSEAFSHSLPKQIASKLSSFKKPGKNCLFYIVNSSNLVKYLSVMQRFRLYHHDIWVAYENRTAARPHHHFILIPLSHNLQLPTYKVPTTFTVKWRVLYKCTCMYDLWQPVTLTTVKKWDIFFKVSNNRLSENIWKSLKISEISESLWKYLKISKPFLSPFCTVIRYF